MSVMARVNREHKCPICNHDTWCLMGRSIVICMRVQSPKVKNFKGGEVGWIHEYGEQPVKLPPTPKKSPVVNVRKVMTEWKRAYPHNRLQFLAHDLGVSIQSLEDLECQYAGDYHNAWGFVMKDGYSNYIGIRIRNLLGQKWAVTGSQAGIFIPNVRPARRMFVAEGPTDTAAGLTLGLYTIGRPSCSGGATHIVDHVRRSKVAEVVIVSDNDEPGIRGAEDLQRWLPVPSCILLLPCKDLREFIKFGDKSTIDSMIEQVVWTQPKEIK